MKNVCLIACASTKLTIPAPAKSLYQSALFSKSIRWMLKQDFDGWFILSAMHELVPPDTILEPYNLTLKNMDASQKKQWSAKVLNSLLHVLEDSASITFLAGTDYRKYLIPLLVERQYKVYIPMEGMRIGEQLQWLTEAGR